jgi:hypothetical protein
MSSSFLLGLAGTRRRKDQAVKKKGFCWLRLLLGLLVFAAIGSPPGGLGVVFRHIEIAGPRQWLNLVASSLIPTTSLVAPVTERIARALPGRLVPTSDEAADIA